MRMASFQCRNLTMVDVGANKGYLLASWLDTFRPEAGVRPSALLDRIGKLFVDHLEDAGGTCNDFKEALAPILSKGQCIDPATGATLQQEDFTLRLHAFEPIPGNADILRGGVQAMLEGKRNVEMTVHQVAVVGNPAITEVEFGLCLAGNERCGVKTDGMDGGAVYSTGRIVPASTLDNWITTNGYDAPGFQFDIVTTDAEGHDPEILKGADKMLRRQGTRVLEFEYHYLREWGKPEVKLEDWVAKLDGYGYDCWMLQKHRTVLRLTGCWSPKYEYKDWGNVMCVLRKESALVAILNGFTPYMKQADKLDDAT